MGSRTSGPLPGLLDKSGKGDGGLVLPIRADDLHAHGQSLGTTPDRDAGRGQARESGDTGPGKLAEIGDLSPIDRQRPAFRWTVVMGEGGGAKGRSQDDIEVLEEGRPAPAHSFAHIESHDPSLG